MLGEAQPQRDDPTVEILPEEPGDEGGGFVLADAAMPVDLRVAFACTVRSSCHWRANSATVRFTPPSPSTSSFLYRSASTRALALLDAVSGGLDKVEQRFYEELVIRYKKNGYTMEHLLNFVDGFYEDKPEKRSELIALIQSKWQEA